MADDAPYLIFDLDTELRGRAVLTTNALTQYVSNPFTHKVDIPLTIKSLLYQFAHIRGGLAARVPREDCFFVF